MSMKMKNLRILLFSLILLVFPLVFADTGLTIASVTTANKVSVNWINTYQSPTQEEFIISVNQSLNPIDLTMLPNFVMTETQLKNTKFELYQLNYSTITQFKTCLLNSPINDCKDNLSCKPIDNFILKQDKSCGEEQVVLKNIIPVDYMTVGKGVTEYKLIVFNPITKSEKGYNTAGTVMLDLLGYTYYDKTHSSWFNHTWLQRYNISVFANVSYTLMRLNITNTTCRLQPNSTRVIYDNTTNIVWNWKNSDVIEFMNNLTTDYGKYALYCNATGVSMGNQTLDLTGSFAKNLSFYWTMDNSSFINGNFTDSIIGAKATNNNNFQIPQCKFAECVNLTAGTFGLPVIGISTIQLTSKSFTILGWQRSQSIATGQVIYQNKESASPNKYAYWGYEGANFGTWYYADDYIYPRTPDYGVWVLSGYTWNSVSKNRTVMINGTYFNITTSVNGVIGNGYYSNIGGLTTNNGYTGVQLIDDFAIYIGRELKDTEVKQIYDYGKNFSYSLNQIAFSEGLTVSESPADVYLSVNITFPVNASILRTENVNATIQTHNTNAVNCFYQNFTGANNISMANCENLSLNLADSGLSNYRLIVYINDSLTEDKNVSIVNFRINPFTPLIIPKEPKNLTVYYSTNISVQYSYNSSTVSQCWYEFSGTNVTLNNCLNSSLKVLNDLSWYNITFYMNNTEGLTNRSAMYFFFVNTSFVVVIPPLLTVYQNDTQLEDSNYFTSFTTDTIAGVLLIFLLFLITVSAVIFGEALKIKGFMIFGGILFLIFSFIIMVKVSSIMGGVLMIFAITYLITSFMR